MNSKKQLLLDGDTAKKLYKTADDIFQTVLEETFGVEFFYEKLTDGIKDVADIYAKLGRKMPTLDNYKHLPDYKRERALNTQYLDDISEYINGPDWVPDFTNRHQRKYYNWFERTNNGWVVDSVVYHHYVHVAHLGSGFYFKDDETARFVAITFPQVYEKIFQNNKGKS